MNSDLVMQRKTFCFLCRSILSLNVALTLKSSSTKPHFYKSTPAEVFNTKSLYFESPSQSKTRWLLSKIAEYQVKRLLVIVVQTLDKVFKV
jgi:hypothetical protein